MKYKVQVHFDNQGQMEWEKDIPDSFWAQKYAHTLTEAESLIEWDDKNRRWVYANMDRVLAIFVQEVQPEPVIDEVICH